MTPTASCTLITLERGPRDLSAASDAQCHLHTRQLPLNIRQATQNLTHSLFFLGSCAGPLTTFIEPFKTSLFTSSKPEILSVATMGPVTALVAGRQGHVTRPAPLLRARTHSPSSYSPRHLQGQKRSSHDTLEDLPTSSSQGL